MAPKTSALTKKPRKPKRAAGRPKKRKDCKNSPRAIKKAKDMATALEFRKQGYSYDAIAEAMGCSKKHAFFLVTDAIKEYRTQELAEDVVALELARLDNAVVGLNAGVNRGDTFAINTLVTVSERRLKLLGHEPAPTGKIELTGKNGEPIEHNHRVQADAAATFDAKFAAIVARSGAATVSGKPDDRGEGG